MKRIAILDDYQNAALAAADWGSLGNDFETTVFDRHLGGEDAVAEALAGFHVLVCMRERTPLPASLIARLPSLELIVTTGMRNLAIDGAAARERGVPLCGTQMTSHAAFEHTWALIFGLTKHLPREDRAMREGGWQVAANVGLKGRTLGVLGLGKLGAQVARIGLAFGMRVIAWSQNLDDARAAEVGVTRVERDALFSESDILTIHLVLGERTRALVGAAELALMKPTAFLVNTSRGPIVDEDALIEALETRRIRAAGLDVYDIEPLPAHHRLRSLENTVLTGHTGYVLEDLFGLCYGQALEDIRAWVGGSPIRVLNDE